ncbi:MAG: putative HTH-type transcriptional regulator [Stenotrophomonas maltophilia]|nr:MAG: putative HTH-type transcriptional regulator [Stenotrophomonas maltophilia]
MPASSALSLTHSPTLRRLLFEALDELGFEPASIYRRALRRVHPGAVRGSARLPHDEVPPFWANLAELTGDGDIGLHLGEVMKPRLLDVVGYLLLSSSDLRDALQSFVRFQAILSGGLTARWGETARQGWLIIDLNYRGEAPLRQQMECLTLLLIKLLASISDGAFHCQAVEFRHPRPPRIAEHRRLFGLEPSFGCAHDRLVFPAALLGRPSRTANPELHGLLTRHAEEQLQALAENDLSNRLRYLLAHRLGRESCSLAACALELGLPPALLQRRLLVAGASFRQLREEAGRQRAEELLAAGWAIREVARACGFSELSPFYRAFRRWFGVPPERYRQTLPTGA